MTVGPVWWLNTASVPTIAPGSPTTPSPVAGATGVATAPRLTWSATGATSYDIRLSTSNPPATVVASNLTAAAYQPTLAAGTRYYWRIVARNSAGSTVGPVWWLNTAGAPTAGWPAPWTSQDIGNVGVSGSATYANGTFTVTGGGLDIWGTADAFQYVSQSLAGEGTIVALVTTLQNTHVNAKAGVMMRGAQTESAQHVMINSAVDGSIEFISRSGAGTCGDIHRGRSAATSRMAEADADRLDGHWLCLEQWSSLDRRGIDDGLRPRLHGARRHERRPFGAQRFDVQLGNGLNHRTLATR